MDIKPTILIIDDAPANIQLLADTLKGDYAIKIATTGARGLELAAVEPQPDLILLDVVMPEMDGFEVCKQLKDQEKTTHIPIIFVTGKNMDEDEELGLEMGAVDYITKPLRPAIVAARVKMHMTIKHQHDRLAYMAMRDQLTGLYNRHYLIDLAQKKICAAKRHHHPLSLIMMDVDHFKLVNDTYGHPVGDEVLKSVAQLMTASNRSEDVVARFGGEEFVILLDMCDLSAAKSKAENLRQSLEDLHPSGLSVTASFGVAELDDADVNFEAFIRHADEAAYRAKEGGRNCVMS